MYLTACNRVKNTFPLAGALSAKPIPGGPKKTGTVDFLGLWSDQQLSFFTLLDRASFPHYNNTKIIKFGWELFILWVISCGLSFSGFAIVNPNRASEHWKNPKNDSPYEITHKIQSSQPNLMILVLLWGKMLYPARWKKITVDQSKVLKNWLYRLFRFGGATRYSVKIKYHSEYSTWFHLIWEQIVLFLYIFAMVCNMVTFTGRNICPLHNIFTLSSLKTYILANILMWLLHENSKWKEKDQTANFQHIKKL